MSGKAGQAPFRVWFDEKGSQHTIVVSPRPEVACQVMRRECTKMVGDMPWAHPERLGPMADGAFTAYARFDCAASRSTTTPHRPRRGDDAITP